MKEELSFKQEGRLLATNLPIGFFDEDLMASFQLNKGYLAMGNEEI